jgi:hypothetical protein
MEMVAHDRLAQQINTEIPSLMDKLVIDSLFAVVVVAAGDRIVTQQKAPPHRAIHHMHNRHFVRGKHLRPSQSGHNATYSSQGT